MRQPPACGGDATIGDQAARINLGEALGAAYTPLSVDAEGRVYAENLGQLFVIGE